MGKTDTQYDGKDNPEDPFDDIYYYCGSNLASQLLPDYYVALSESKDSFFPRHL